MADPMADPIAHSMAHHMTQPMAPTPDRGGDRGGDGGGVGRGAGPSRGAMRGNRHMGAPEGIDPPTRPKHLATKQGTKGTMLKLVANYFPLKKVPDWSLRLYRVDIAPDEDRTSERKFLLKAHKDKLGGYLFDGTVLYTTRSLTSPQNRSVTWTSSSKDGAQIYTITIKDTGKEGTEVQVGDYAYIQVYNLLVRACIGALGLQLVGRDFYDANAKIPLAKHGIELWPGYKTSIRQHESDILMCVEVAHKVMRMETVYDILREVHKRSSNPNDFRKEFERQVLSCIVLTKYNNKTYRIDDVNWDVHPDSTFESKKGGGRITYVQYMYQRYQITIGDLKQPMLVSRAKARDIRRGMADIIHLIPELCSCTGLTEGMRTNFHLMKDLAVYTRVSPDVRIQKLRDFNKRLQHNREAVNFLRSFGMTLDQDLVKLQGRQLEGAAIVLGGNTKCPPDANADWTYKLKYSHMYKCVQLENWVVVTPSAKRREVANFIDCLKKAGVGMNFRINSPEIREIQHDTTGKILEELGYVLDRTRPQLIMCLVTGTRADRYSAIKKRCCVDRAVPTQVLLAKNVQGEPRKMMSVATKVAIQMNCKIGGSPWTVSLPQGLMVVGFDVCHDTMSRNQSYGAMVASLTDDMSKYFSVVSAHTCGEELSNNFALNIVKAIRKYMDVNNGAKPMKIVIYRDGVGEGQLPYVVSTELEGINEKLKQIYSPDEVKMSFVIVTKRINTRIFSENRCNPPPGTVVDSVVTDPAKYDFFLVSQSVRDGTVSPTSYNVIHDGIHWSPDIMQKLSYNLCHLYFNWSGTVRVPAPCQYAHKLAFLVGQAIHRQPNAQMEDTLYFL